MGRRREVLRIQTYRRKLRLLVEDSELVSFFGHIVTDCSVGIPNRSTL